jgi:hypothetical protein
MADRKEIQPTEKQGSARLEKERLLQEKAQYAKDQLDRERLTRVTGEVVETITSPEFVERMRKARLAADAGSELDVAANLLSIEGLRAAGANIPADFRLTSRIFEDREQGFRLELRSTLGTDAISQLGWGACAGAGGLSFCGCGGFSTLR